jgi:hypothetical protein
MEKLFNAIEAEGAIKRKPGFAFDLRTKVSEFFSSFAPRTLAYASGAAALVILLQAGVIGGMALNSGNRGDYGVASIGDNVKVESVDFFVNFSSNVTTDQLTAFLRTNHGKIVDGPKGGMTYQVRFDANGKTKDEIARLQKVMEENRNVVRSDLAVGK